MPLGEVHREFQHVGQLPFVFRGADIHIWDPGEIGKVKDPLMGLPVASHKPRPVHGKHYGQVLKADVVKDLVIGPLQKGGINRHNGPQAPRRKPCGKSHRMFLRDPHIEKAIRIHIVEPL